MVEAAGLIFEPKRQLLKKQPIKDLKYFMSNQSISSTRHKQCVNLSIHTTNQNAHPDVECLPRPVPLSIFLFIL